MRLPNRGSSKRPMLKAAQARVGNPWSAVYNKPCPAGQVCHRGYCVYPVPPTQFVAYGGVQPQLPTLNLVATSRCCLFNTNGSCERYC